MSTDFKYSAYCVVFWFKENGIYHVWTWNELTDKVLKKYQCKTREEAEELCDSYVSHAPDHVICQKINGQTLKGD